MTQNKRNRILGWSDAEKMVFPKFHGKIPLSEMTNKVNEVSKTTRTESHVRAKMNIMGFSVVVNGG